MFSLRLERFVDVVGGRLICGEKDAVVNGAYTDTRSPEVGAAFIAISGERFDGHDYANLAANQGASVVVVSREDVIVDLRARQQCGVVQVADTRSAYLRFASAYRLELTEPIWFAVTGSVGKSSVKELLAHILDEGAGWNTHRAVRSFNNDIGVPTTILAAPPDSRAVVLELGTNHPGEIARLAGVARPNVAIITNAGASHLEGLGSVRGVAEEKSHILDFQSDSDSAVLNVDDQHYELWRLAARGRVITFGTGNRCDLSADSIAPSRGGVSFTLSARGATRDVCLPLPGRHNVLNALAASAAAIEAGVDLDGIVMGLESFAGVARRLQVHEHRGITVIDDAYNANPESFRAALEVVESYAGRRVFIVAGDMLELGAGASAHHEALGRRMAVLNPIAVVTVGDLAEVAGRAAVESGLNSDAWSSCESPQEAGEFLKRKVREGDVVLVKGSNGVGLNRCVSTLLEKE